MAPPRRIGEPSCFQRCFQGFLMGGFLGATIGVLMGGFAGYRGGQRGRALIQVIGRSALTSAGSFGFFLSIGTAIRSC
jgi:hypothetical protein